MKILTNVCWSVLKRWGGSKLHSKVAAAPLQKFNQGSRETELEIRRARLFDHESSLSFSKLHKSSFWAPFELLLSSFWASWAELGLISLFEACPLSRLMPFLHKLWPYFEPTNTFSRAFKPEPRLAPPLKLNTFTEPVYLYYRNHSGPARKGPETTKLLENEINVQKNLKF